MLLFSTSLDHTSLVNILNRLLEDGSEDIKDMANLVLQKSTMNPDDDIVFRTRLMATEAMLKDNQIETAKILLKNLSIAEISVHAKSIKEIQFVLKALVFTDQSKLCLEYLKNHGIGKEYSAEDLIGLKLLIAWFMVMKSDLEHAEAIIADIDPCIIEKTKHFESLLILNIYLGCDEQILRIIKRIETKKHIYPNYYTHLALYHLCLGDVESANTAIEKQQKPTAAYLHWKARLQNIQNDHCGAMRSISMMKKKFMALGPVERCFALIEEGNTLRALSRYDEALSNYIEAQKIDIGPVFWLWLAYFEHAVTLAYLHKDNNALVIASKGAKVRSCRYNSAYNPCRVLKTILLIREGETSYPGGFLVKIFDNALLWPFPIFPHKYWMIFLIAYGAIKKGENGVIRRVLSVLNESQMNFLDSETKCIPDMKFETQSVFKIQLDYFKSAIFPNDFFWIFFDYLCGNKADKKK